MEQAELRAPLRPRERDWGQAQVGLRDWGQVGQMDEEEEEDEGRTDQTDCIHPVQLPAGNLRSELTLQLYFSGLFMCRSLLRRSFEVLNVTHVSLEQLFVVKMNGLVVELNFYLFIYLFRAQVWSRRNNRAWFSLSLVSATH